MAARNNNNKTEAASSVLEKALKVLRANKLEKVFVTKDEYIFLKESDVRAYVGKDGNYKTITENSKTGRETQKEESPEAGDKGKVEPKTEAKKGEASDKVVDEHKKTEG